jgi:hypothetical protein
MSVQPPISTIPCKILYLLANPVLPFPMFSSPAASPTNRSLRPRPSRSHRCHPERSEASCLVRPLAPIAPSEQSLLCRRPLFRAVGCELSTVNCHPLSPFPATLTDNSQLTENSATLSPVPATLTRRVKHNPFVCHSYKKHPGGGVPPSAGDLLFPQSNHSLLTTLHYLLYIPHLRKTRP